MRGKALRHTDQRETGFNSKWIPVAAGGVVLFSGLISAASYFIFERQESPKDWYEAIEAERKALEQDLTHAHDLWEQEERLAAVKAYKAILRHEDRSYVRDDIPILYRRVIEFEVEYGDPAVGRDWCLRASDDNALDVRLSFDSDKATQIWNEVLEANGEH